MFTDIVGYTARAQADEATALRLVEEQEELVRPLLAVHHGREVKSTGDGLLVEFDSARDAVQCGVEIQERLRDRGTLALNSGLQLRIGIHVGDVERRGSDIVGDTVNLASRIESASDPGGVCLSAQAFDQIRNKVPFALEKLGPRTLKGVQEPLVLYRVVLPGQAPQVAAVPPGPTRLAVLPFANISPDAKDEYFADGLTEELITLLSQLHDLQVIARTSVMAYKAAPKPIAQIGAELGVTSILEGSVRKSGDQLRITVQLIDVRSQGHTWANTYDRKLDDVFAIQTEVAKRIVKALQIRVRTAEATRLEERQTVKPASYLAYLKGRSLMLEGEEDQGAKQFELAISLDPTNARAFSGLADVGSRRLRFGDYRGSRLGMDAARRAHAARAVELDPDLAEAHCSLAEIRQNDYDCAAAEKEFKLALALNPSYSTAHLAYAVLLLDEDRRDEAREQLSLAEECDPHSTYIVFVYACVLGWLRCFDDMKAKVDRLREIDTEGSTYFTALGYYHYNRGEDDLALQAANRVEQIEPGGAWIMRALYTTLHGDASAREKLREELRVKERFPTSWQVATCYALLGDLDACFRVMEKSVDDHCLIASYFRLVPRLEAVRQDPRFAQVLHRMNLA